MKKLMMSFAAIVLCFNAFAQPILQSDSLHTGQSFSLYALNNVLATNLAPTGANLTWDISTSTATLLGTVDFLNMNSTPYAAQYPTANFAMKFVAGANTSYSLFNHTATILEEVANNVGTPSPVAFTDYRTALVFPFTYNLVDNDTYQKTGQVMKTISNSYTGYGTFISNFGSNSNIVQNVIDDNGNTSYFYWKSSPLVPLFQGSSSGFTLWQQNVTPNSVRDYTANALFDLYPNPAENTLSILNKELISNIEVYDAQGKLQFSTTQSVIDISALRNGTYFLRATSAKGSTTQKFIKK